MYRHCIYCSAGLGTNQALEAFPVGRTLAFDAARGRLWAVCATCARWNLAPIEERWEPVEEAERLFRDARLRVQSENVGLARLPDGTRLIRVGVALAGELAAWRYGGQLAERRRRYLWAVGGVAAAGLATMGAAYTAVGIGLAVKAYAFARGGLDEYRLRRHVLTIPAQETPHGRPVRLQRRDMVYAVLHPGLDDGIEVHLGALTRRRSFHFTADVVRPAMVIPDRTARRLIERSLVHMNQAGARPRSLARAMDMIASVGSAERYIRQHAAGRSSLEFWPRWAWWRGADPTSLALEMALHEEQERRALEGELAVLEAAWRDAEPIAEIADRLATDPGSAQ